MFGCGYTSKGRDDFNNHLQKHEGDKEVTLVTCVITVWKLNIFKISHVNIAESRRSVCIKQAFDGYVDL